MTFFWSSPDFGREIGRHAVRLQGSVKTATKLLGFGRLARVKKHCYKDSLHCIANTLTSHLRFFSGLFPHVIKTGRQQRSQSPVQKFENQPTIRFLSLTTGNQGEPRICSHTRMLTINLNGLANSHLVRSI